MDNRTRLVRLKKMIDTNLNVGERVPIGRLKKLIMFNVGSDDRVIESSLRTMIESGMIIEVENFIFEIRGLEDGY